MRRHARLRLGAGDGDWDTTAEEGERWVSIQFVLLTRYVRPFASFPSSADLLLQLPRSKTVCGSRARLDADVHVEAPRYERKSGRHWRRLNAKAQSVWTDACTFQRGTELVFWRTRWLEHLVLASEERRAKGRGGRTHTVSRQPQRAPTVRAPPSSLPFPSLPSHL
jgi:hypothetical protein